MSRIVNKKSEATKTSAKANKKKHYQSSEETLSIQNYEFPGPNKPQGAKALMKVKHHTNLLHKTKSQSDPSSKKNRYDLTSSSNSHYNNWVFPVPLVLRNKFPSTTTEELVRETTTSSIKTLSEKSGIVGKVRTSTEMANSRRRFSEKPKQFNGPEWRQPGKDSVEARGPPKFIGTCPPNIEQLSKMSRERQKFFMTQDPRKVQCLVNPVCPKGFSKKKEFETFSNMVKHAQNTCDTDASSNNTDEQFICEVIDLENPFQLDFQGLDYKNTFQKDEQDLLNQHNYLRLCRYMERKKVKHDIKIQFEEKKRQEKLQIPECFKVCDRKSPEPTPPPPPPEKLAKLFRSDAKPCNRRTINMERERREQRYKDLYLEFRARRQEEEQAMKDFKSEQQQNRHLIMADKKFKNIADKIDAVVKRNFKKETKIDGLNDKTNITKCATPSKTMGKSEKSFKKITENFDSNIDDKDSHVQDNGEKNAKNIIIGMDGDVFMLRGLDTDTSKSVKGRFLQPEGAMMQGCKTREQWLMELAPIKEKVKLDVEVGIQPLRSLDDPKLPLFDNLIYKPPKCEISEVKAFRLKPLGRHYDRILRKPIRYSKPRLKYNVKKFNLIRFRFGDTAKKHSEKKIDIAEFEKTTEKNSTMEYIEEKVAKRRILQEEIKMKRLELLGIPCKKVKVSRLHTTCELSASSSDSEWVPNKEPDYTRINEEECTDNVRDIMLLNMRTNMPAPKYREPTLRQHPGRRRNYKDNRVPSQIFDDVVLMANHPYMYKLPSDAVREANPNIKVRPFYKIGEAKHHHDHLDPTQEIIVDVHYQPILVKPKITEARNKADRISIEKFEAANPPCNRFVEMNITMPKWNVDAIIQDHRESVEHASGQNKDFGTIQIKDICKQRDFVSHSRDHKELEELDYPGRKEYLKLLGDVKVSLNGSIHSEDPSDKLYVNKADFLTDVEENIKSIESCLTSLSSSECTNLTNDSGSFLVMEGKEKVPLDYIRKSLLPFEEIHRSRFQAEPIDVEKEEQNPFNVLPFCGQRRSQQELIRPKDSFFTFSTRLKNGLRLRLEVPVEDVRKKLMGRGTHKYPGLVATDIDENYIKTLKCRPSIRPCKFTTRRAYIQDAMRLKFESMLVQGQIVRTKIFDRLNDQHWTDMHTIKNLYENLFVKWQKKEYEVAMEVVNKVKAFYDETDRLKSEFKIVDKELVILNMDIVFIENHWIRCVMLQNFHYLMGVPEWRIEHDWIHRLPSDEDDEVVRMENFDESILKRSQANIRHREKDDAWAIKTFYEQCYLPNKHENLLVFPEPESFFARLKSLRDQTFEILLEMHFILSIHTELQGKLETFVQWSANDLKDRKAYVERKYSKLYFTDDRIAWLKKHTLGYVGQPVDDSFKDEDFLRSLAVTSEVWRHIVPAKIRDECEIGLSAQLDPVDMVAMMSDVVMEVMSKFETIPMTTSDNIEKIVRKRRERLMKQSQQAYYVEKRIEHELKTVIRNLEPPSRVMSHCRPSKLPRYYLKRPAKVVKVQKTEISEVSKLYFEAFNEVDEDMPTTEVKDSIIQVGTAVKDQEVPFYFDHFLELNGYKPDYSFKTKVEMRDGPELDRMQFKKVLPEVRERIAAWEILKKKIMQAHIAQNPQMYVNVV